MTVLATTWKLDVRRGPGWLLVKVGRWEDESPDMPPLAEPLWAILEQHFNYRLVLELDEIPSLTGEFLDQLLVLKERILEHDGVLRLCGLSPRNQRVLRRRGLDGRLACYRDVEEAVMGSSAAKPR
jgi:hypothetical protein